MKSGFAFLLILAVGQPAFAGLSGGPIAFKPQDLYACNLLINIRAGSDSDAVAISTLIYHDEVSVEEFTCLKLDEAVKRGRVFPSTYIVPAADIRSF